MRRTYEVSGHRDDYGNFHPPDEGEMMRKLLAIREHLEDFGGAMVVVPKRARIRDAQGNTIRYENWGLIFRYNSSAPVAEEQQGEPEPDDAEPPAELEAEPEPALTAE